MERAYYSDTIESFLKTDSRTIQGSLSTNSDGAVEQTQIAAWEHQITVLQEHLESISGRIFFEYSIPRMGKRVDVVLATQAAIFILEFKFGSDRFDLSASDQVWDYALDLKNFHKTSHDCLLAPILIASEAEESTFQIACTPQNDNLLFPIHISPLQIDDVLREICAFAGSDQTINAEDWEHGQYCPTPSIIEAALALYRGHSVKEISRTGAGDVNLHKTSDAISKVITRAQEDGHKAICFVTGVPGAGKTLIGLDIATKHLDQKNNSASVFLSGNGPLVHVLQEALARDLVEREKAKGVRLNKSTARSRVKAFVQNVHHYRDDCLISDSAPYDHVALFDEAQRAWNVDKTIDFMKKKKGQPDFSMSEPEFLISCIDRHKDWGVVVCLIGGGQEIHTGEAGIGEWINALNRSYPDWHIHISSRLTDSEYEAGKVLELIKSRSHVTYRDDLHLSVSMRSFRAENLSLLVKQLLDLDLEAARKTRAELAQKYPIVITRSVDKAKQWLKQQARGSERYGMVVSSQAQRLRPYAIHVKSPMDPVHWFLHGKDDVRSSYYLEDVATEFSIQGLELDWVCVTWDGDFIHGSDGWTHRAFKGTKWQMIRKDERKAYLKNAYRVLLTRARQGMVIVVPDGDPDDATRDKSFYDPTYQYLSDIGFKTI